MTMEIASKAIKNSYGLFNYHSYTVLGGIELADGTKLVKIRNPHGNEAYRGPWSDTWTGWTDDLKAEFNEKLGEAGSHVLDTEDAAFWMPFTVDDNLGGLYGLAKGLWVNLDVTGWHSAYFLRLDDDGTGTTSPTYYKGNSEHVLEVSSDVDQQVFIFANTWQYDAYPRPCGYNAYLEHDSGTRNYAVISGNGEALAWAYGSRNMSPI